MAETEIAAIDIGLDHLQGADLNVEGPVLDPHLKGMLLLQNMIIGGNIFSYMSREELMLVILLDYFDWLCLIKISYCLLKYV